MNLLEVQLDLKVLGLKLAYIHVIHSHFSLFMHKWMNATFLHLSTIQLTVAKNYFR